MKTHHEVPSRSECKKARAPRGPSSSPGQASKNSSMVEWTLTLSPHSVSLGYGADAFFLLQRFANASPRIRLKLCSLSSLLLFTHFSISRSTSLCLSPSFSYFLSVAARGQRNNSNSMHIASALVSATASE